MKRIGVLLLTLATSAHASTFRVSEHSVSFIATEPGIRLIGMGGTCPPTFGTDPRSPFQGSVGDFVPQRVPDGCLFWFRTYLYVPPYPGTADFPVGVEKSLWTIGTCDYDGCGWDCTGPAEGLRSFWLNATDGNLDNPHTFETDIIWDCAVVGTQPSTWTAAKQMFR
jgi:hypothetical protein